MADRHSLPRKIRHWAFRDLPYPGFHFTLRNKLIERLAIVAIRVIGNDVHRDGLATFTCQHDARHRLCRRQIVTQPLHEYGAALRERSKQHASVLALVRTPPFDDHHTPARLHACHALTPEPTRCRCASVPYRARRTKP